MRFQRKREYNARVLVFFNIRIITVKIKKNLYCCVLIMNCVAELTPVTERPVCKYL